MTTKISQAAIKQGKRLKQEEQQNQWKWGDVLVKASPPDSTPEQVTASIQVFVAEVFPELDEHDQRIRGQWMKLCRLTSIAWPVEHRVPEISHKVHEIFKRNPNRYKMVRSRKWTITDAYRANSIATLARTTVNSPSKERAKAAAKLLADKKVAELLMADPSTRILLMEAAFKVNKRQVEKDITAEIASFEPEFARASGYTKASQALYQGQVNLEKALELTMATENLSDPMREALLRQARKAQLACGFLVSHLESGDRSFEDSMRTLLTEETK